MKTASKEYIINTVYRTNTLPVISKCNTSCIFCSHKQNPQEVEIFKVEKLDLNDFSEIIEYLSKDKKIVIGESATKIIEGEPFLHKDILEILKMIRKKYKKTVIQITTNGILLNEKIINTLKELQNIELNISVNCIDEDKRIRILGLKEKGNIKEKILLLKDRIKYNASAVLMPDVFDKDEIEEMVEFLNDNGVSSIRFYMQGCTRKSGNSFYFYDEYFKLSKTVESLKSKYRVPIVLEPAVIENLDCIIEGVIKDAPAFKAGIVEGDSIEKVDGLKVKSRVDGFNKVTNKKNPELVIERKNEKINIVIEKEKGEVPGFIVLYDINPDTLIDINRLVTTYKAQNVLFMTSELAFGILKKLFFQNEINFNYEIIKVKNKFFGGTIKCAGLLTTQDIISVAKEYIDKKGEPDLIVLPPIMFDNYGRDLTGRKISEVEKELNISVDTPLI
ncbi:DUF512 domain-containing protein [Herbivorax sp. ANBcel31]|uniref:DUF512 domain-containing protein n=1 Tax=Herbivorax sp. ANBcel31 TaxID=3069754 RepID=UPI0027AF02EC|nr:DUF512 domain-containing protein [Herbivorax sp. ANBcel31]MDQ2086666.1 DUF512 domain-containing protein [Herbivorax sp. ANBcel31]